MIRGAERRVVMVGAMSSSCSARKSWLWTLLLAPTLFGCGARTSDDARTPIVIWGQAIGPDSKGLEAVVREFERRNPEYRVRMLGMGAGGMNPQKLMTSIVGKAPPDAIYQDRFTISDWASRGAFRALDDLIERDRGQDPSTPTPEQYYDVVWQEASYEGRTYGIPSGCDDRVLYYNKAIFRQEASRLRAAGLDPGRPPRTWSELLAYSKVLTQFGRAGSIRRAGFLPNYGNAWLYIYAFQNEGKFLTEDGTHCTLTDPANREALEFMVRGYGLLGGFTRAQAVTAGYVANESDPFIAGKVAMKIDGDWIINGLSRYAPNLDFGVAPAPVPDDRYHRRGRFEGEEDQFVTWSGGFSYAIPNGARNVEGAWKFIKFAMSLEGRRLDMAGQREWERMKGRVYVPRLSGMIAANEVILSEFMPGDRRIATALRLHIELLPKGRIRPATPVGQVLWDAHVRALENACRGLETPAQALARSEVIVQRELDAIARMRELPDANTRAPMVIVAACAVGGALLLLSRWRRLRLGKLARYEARHALWFLAPWLIGFLVFTLGPMLASIYFSFTQYNVLNPAKWVGLGNYRDLATTDAPAVLKSFTNVAYLGGIGVPLGIVTGLAIAMLLNLGVGGMRVYRTMFYMPSIVPAVAAVVLWTWLLTPAEGQGLVNSFWNATITEWFGLAAPGWLTAPEWTKPALILMGVWGAGGGMLLWLAGLKGVPRQLYEASCIDGASAWRQLWSVTIPQLSPIIFFNSVMGCIGALQEFDRAWIMKGEAAGGPGDSLLLPVVHLFNNGFSYFKMGYASAIAWLIFAVVLVLTLIQFRIAPRWVHYEVER